MALNYHYPIVNPHLGSSFGIFTSAYVCLVLMLVILEQLGLSKSNINQLIVITPVLFYAAIGVFVRTSSIEDFFVSGQRVPALYNGFALAGGLIGGTGLLGFTGASFFLGFDALALALGWCAGLALMAVLFAPYLRKAGAYTLPGFLGLRFGSRALRFTAALLTAVPCVMLLAAELKTGAAIAAVFLPLPAGFLMNAGLALILATVLLGGMRSLTWSQCAQFIVLLLGISVPLVIVSIMLTNLPLPQLTYGTLLEELPALETAKGLSRGAPQALSEALPSTQPQGLGKSFLTPFAGMSAASFILLAICLMLGTAALPGQVARMSTSPNVPAMRQAFGWSVLCIGFLFLTLPAYAVFTKYFALKHLIGLPLAELPDWSRALEQLGFIKITGNQLDPAHGGARIFFSRDTVALLLPVAAELPHIMLGLAGAAAIAAVTAAAAAQIVTVANAFSNDIYYPVIHRTASPARRLLIARLAMVLTGIAGLWLARGQDFDPLRCMLWAFSLAAGSFFAVLTMAIWWKRLTMPGTLLGMILGFASTAAYIFFNAKGQFSWLGADHLTAGALGVPIAFITAAAVSLVTKKPEDQAAELTEELRLPGGETLHARLTRLAARGKAPRP